MFQVDTDSPAFPRSLAYWWLGCSSAPRGTVGGNARISSVTHDADADADVGDIVFDAGMSGAQDLLRLGSVLSNQTQLREL